MADRRPPNILFFYNDDQRADTIRALGNLHITTPNLDRLVRSGTAFRRAYCMGALQGAVCVPSRAMMLTGRTLFRARTDLQGQETWPELFGRAGYTTFITGKWHNHALGLLRSFQQGKAVFLGGMGDPYNLPVQDIGPGEELINPRMSGKHSVELFADCAVEFLRRQREARPFLCYVAFNSPHDPRVAPPEYHAPYDAAKPPLPPNFLPQHPFNNGEMTGRDERLAPWPRTPEIVRQHLADYYAAITFMDAQMGRIFHALEESGQYENTILVFSSDHALAIGSHGLFGKQNLYEHSMRVPLLLAGPGIPKNRQSDAFCYVHDIFTTLGELAAIAPPGGCEGVSLLPVVTGQVEAVRDSIFTAYRTIQRAVRDERWKLIIYTHINKKQLFDLQNDPHEVRDLAEDPAHAPQIERLTSRLEQWQEALDDSQPLSTDTPAPLHVDLPSEPRTA